MNGTQYIIHTYMYALQQECLRSINDKNICFKVKKHEIKEVKYHLKSRQVEVILCDIFNSEITILNPYYEQTN